MTVMETRKAWGVLDREHYLKSQLVPFVTCTLACIISVFAVFFCPLACIGLLLTSEAAYLALIL